MYKDMKFKIYNNKCNKYPLSTDPENMWRNAKINPLTSLGLSLDIPLEYRSHVNPVLKNIHPPERYSRKATEKITLSSSMKVKN